MFLLLLLAACADPPPQAHPPEDADADGVPDRLDCAPADASVHPSAEDPCDHVDNDCDGEVDEDATVTTWYADWDDDGFGDLAEPIRGCDPPPDAALIAGDCNPNDWAAYPGAAERCNDQDDDCDGIVDEDPRDSDRWYHDLDGDGWGDGATAHEACDDPGPTWVLTGTDCVDTDAAVHPEALERCAPPGVDDDCDGSLDEDGASGGTAWYPDEDGDGVGAGEPRWGCAGHSDESPLSTDCDDEDANVAPGRSEHCDGVDEDCDGGIDEEAVDRTAWFTDADGDGHGDPGTLRMACTDPSGTVSRGDDCDDTDAAVHPNAEEDCALAVDYNCDGLVGTDDTDGDGYAACDECDDGDAGVYPGAFETCDGVDEDCDGDIDVGAPGYVAWHPDADLDGYGDHTIEARSCTPIADWVLVGGDCDDADGAIHPGAVERCRSAADDDCDGETNDRDAVRCSDYAADADGDGEPGTEVVCLCSPAGPYVFLEGGDCDDDDPTVLPTADDTDCDGLDVNCDGADCDVSVLATVGPLLAMGGLVPAGDVPAGIWVGEPDTPTGYVALFAATGTVTTDDYATLVSASASNDTFGAAIDVADVDGDGADDLLIGAPLASNSYREAGSVYFVPGPVTGSVSVDDVAVARWDGGGVQDYAGYPVYSEDLTGDGLADGWIASPDDDAGGRKSGSVSRADLSLTGSLTTDDADIRILGEAEYSHFGRPMVAPGDVSGDGVDDLVVAAPLWDDATTGETGVVYVFAGPIQFSTVAADADARWAGGGGVQSFGEALFDAADADGDGVGDHWVKGWIAGSEPALYLLRRPGDAGGDPDDAAAVVVSPVGTTGFGNAAVGTLDFDDSGGPDLFVTDPSANSDLPQSGAVSIYLDPSTGVITAADAVYSGTSRYSYLGMAVAPLIAWGDPARDTVAVADDDGYFYVLDIAEVFP